MSDMLKNVFGGAKPDDGAPAQKRDSDFADFAGAPDPVPEPEPVAAGGAALPDATARPYTKWYRVDERYSLSDFKAEGVILVISLFILLFHVIGSRKNRFKARKWMLANARTLRNEFALVGFSGVPIMDGPVDPSSLLKESSLFEFATYASGRQNVAFMDVKLTLSKKFNPIMNSFETALSFFMPSVEGPSDVMEASIYPFDGKENLTVPSLPGSEEARAKIGKSTFDGFVWAIVNKECMQKVREGRYDVSLTSTKDSPKLPNWLTIMSESAEISDTLLTPELIESVKAADSLFEYLIITDQPVERPTTLEETVPRKRLFLKYRLPSDGNYDGLVPLFENFVRLPDFLVQNGNFRAEAMRKVRTTRDHMAAQIKKAAEEEKNEERIADREKAKKMKRDAELAGLDAKAQKKYLEKEEKKEMRRSQKKQQVRG